MKNNKAFSLTELLVGIAVLSIMSGIAVVSYNSYIPDVEKRSLCDSAILFAVGAKTCIMNVGRWTYNNQTPCKAITKNDLNDKFDYKCPDKATCKGEEATTGDYYCLKIEENKYNIFVHLNTDKLCYDIYSGELADPDDPPIDLDCKKNPNYSSKFKQNTEFCQEQNISKCPTGDGSTTGGGSETTGGGTGTGTGGGDTVTPTTTTTTG